MRFLPGHAATSDLTYGDVFLVPSRSEVTSRFDVDLTAVDGTGTTIPIVVANMTAVAGRRMAETVARRGGITVLPQDVPTDVVAEVVASVKARHTVIESAVVVSPHDTVHTALTLIGKRAHGAAVVVDGGRPVGVVTEADCQGVDRFTQVDQVMSAHPTTVDLAIVEQGGLRGLEAAFEKLHGSRRKFSPVVRDGELVGVLTQVGALRSSIYQPALDADGRLRVAAAVGINGDVKQKALELLEAGRRRARRRHRARAPAQDARRARRRPLARPAGAGRRGQRGHRRGHARPDRRGRGHRQGRRRTRRHVHHAHDDRRRPPAVLRGARVRRGGTPAGQARVGRRRRPPPARRRPGARGRRVAGHGRLVVRRHARVARRPARGRQRPPLQGELRHGLGARRRGPHPRRLGVRPGAQGAVRGGHLVLPDVPGPAPPRRRGPHRPHHRGRALRRDLRRRDVARRARTSAPWSASSRPPATRRGARCPTGGDRACVPSWWSCTRRTRAPG